MRASPRAWRATVFGALVAALLGCGPAAPTQLLVLIDGDLRVPDDVDALVVRTASRGHPVATRTIPLGTGPGRHSLTGGFGVAPTDGDEAARPVTVEIDVMRGACRRFTYRAEGAFEPGRVTRVSVYLSRRCAGPAAAEVCAPRELCAAEGRTCGRDGACVDAHGQADATPPPRPRDVPTQGAAVAISADDARAVVALRRSPYFAVLDLDLTGSVAPNERRVAVRAVLPYAMATPPIAPADVDPEGWATVINNDGTAAWVVLRRAQRVLRIDNLRGEPRFATVSAPTGSEPTGLALAPSGRHLYVTNFGDGTVTVIAAASMRVEMTLDLNGPLARSGRLGAVAPRPALAHPRAITISNDGDGDDADEVAWVTEFYGQWRDPAEVPLSPERDAGYWDVARVGVMYRIPLDTHLPDERLTVIPPTDDSGFDDATGRRTSCFPNLLYAAHWNRGRVYVTGTCASPSGPVGEACRRGATCTPLSPDDDFDPGNHRTLSHAAVYVVDPTTPVPATLPTRPLTLRYWEMYTHALTDGITSGFGGAPEGPRRRMPLLPLGMAFIPGDYVGYVLGYGSDAMFRVRFDAGGQLREVGSGDRAEGFIDLDPDEARRGRLPAGVAIRHRAEHLETALVVNADTANVSVVDLTVQTVERVVSLLPAGVTESPEAAAVREGRRLFVTGRDRMSWRGQAWSSCETCHPDGLSDGLTWYFARGPRQSPSLDSSFVHRADGTNLQRLFGWNASFDEVHDVESVIRGVSGGVGAFVHDAATPPTRSQRILYLDDRSDGGDASHTGTSQAGLNGAIAAVPSAVPDLARLEAYVRSIRAPRRPVGLAEGDVAAGRQAFASYCAGCHGGALWSVARRFYAPSESNNATRGRLRLLRYVAPERFPLARNPALLATSDAAFRYDGAEALRDSMQCAVRAVGTLGDGRLAVALAGVPVREVRTDMLTDAFGADGFSPPSLLGLSLSAPYFHAGQARTLEAVFDETFAVHHKVWCQNCFNPGSEQLPSDLRAIVSYLLSIDDDTDPARVQAPYLDAAADLCAQGEAMFR